MEIKRDFYLNKLVSKQNNGLIKIITGIRRCGKSYLLNNIFYNYLLNNGVSSDHIIRFAFDSADDLSLIGENLLKIEKERRKVDPEKFISYIKSKIKDDKMYYLLLDEVQELGFFESVLNGYLYKQNIDVYVTGSNAKFLSKDIITEFSGRGDEIHLYPLSFLEFMSVSTKDRTQALIEYMQYGGIPLVVLENNETEKINILKRLFNEIYIVDIEKRYNIHGIEELENILDMISSAIGDLTNPEKLKNTFKTVKKIDIASNTIKKYLEYLNESFLIEIVDRYDVKGKEYIKTSKKYYFSDLGLRNARINFRQFEMGHVMENIVYNELLRRGYAVDVGVVPTTEYDKDKRLVRKQLEVDFVCNLGAKRYYIQSAYSLPNEDKKNSESKSLMKIKDSFKKIIITGDMIPKFYNDEGILNINIFDFLLDEKSLDY